MTYTIVALTNDKAQLIVNEKRTTSVAIRDLTVAHLTAEGYKVVVKEEG